MTIPKALNWATSQLKSTKIASASLDAEVILSYALGKPKEFLYTYPEKRLTKRELHQFKSLIKRRKKFEPVAYLVGHKEFFGLDFYIDKNVLIPRPETEILVEEVKKHLKERAISCKLLIIEVGTGSGCITTALAKTLYSKLYTLRPQIYALDSSQKALPVARKNAKLHHLDKKITFLKSNLLKKILLKHNFIIHNSKFIILLANLPYLTTGKWQKLPPEIKNYEPRLALDGGLDGLKYFHALFKQINSAKLWTKNTLLFLEIDPRQIRPLKKLTQEHFPQAQIQIKKDLAGLDRVMIISISILLETRR